MGEVYRATDTKLGRDVAIKVLPADVAQDAERLARFEREAKLLASLNHPNIAQVYGFETATLPGGSAAHFLAMELVEGEELADRLKRGPIPVDEALAIARQIAEGLEEAHEKGIVHRDLKPANVKVTPDGKIKVLDFGLAKAYAGEAATQPGADLSQSPTLAHTGTQAGVILGTAAYMSPEQARGKPVDKRADIWAFGVVLYEMLAGQRLFEGETVSDVLAGVLKTEVDLGRLEQSTPPAIRRLLRSCLERNPKNRLHDIADARLVLDETMTGQEDRSAAAGIPARGRRAVWLIGAGALGVGLALGWLLTRGLPSGGAGRNNPPFHAEFQIPAPAGTNVVGSLALSPDGQQLAFVARGEDGRTALWIRSLAWPEAKMLAGTAEARFPFWSPDSRRIGFFAQSRLKVTDLLGGETRVVAETGVTTDIRGGAWGVEDVIVFTPSPVGSLYRVSARGGKAEAATRIAEGSGTGTHRLPSFLPDGKRFLFYASSGNGVEPGTLYLGELGSLDTKALGPATSAGIWAEPGYVLYARGESLVAHRFDDRQKELVGAPTPLGIVLPGSVAVAGLRSLAAAANGVLVYRPDKRGATRLVEVDRSGVELRTIAEEKDTWYYAPRLSPDGRRLAVSHYEPSAANGDLWLHELERGVETRLALGSGDNIVAAWSPESREIVYQSVGRAPTGGIFRVDPVRPGEERAVLPVLAFPEGWTPDGKRLVYVEVDPSGRNSLWIRSLDGDPGPRRLGPEHASEWASDLSPDGRFIAYTSDASRRSEVYVRALDRSSGEVRVSTEGGFTPRWRRDGRELYYIDENQRLMAVPVPSLDPPTFGSPRALFAARVQEDSIRQYDVFPDGWRFILSRTLVEGQEPISAVLGWTARMEKEPRR